MLGVSFIGFALSKVESRQNLNRPPYSPTAVDSGEPLLDVPIVDADSLSEPLADDALVIGVLLKGKARAYPLSMLTKRGQAVVNDELAGVPIVVTWSKECINGRVFDRRLDNSTLEFFRAANSWNGSLVILDAETSTYWSQLLGEALQDGRALTPLVCEVLSWEGWRRRYPQTTVIDLPSLADGPTTELLEAEGIIYGAVIDDAAIHWSMDLLLKSGGVSCFFKDYPLLVLINPQTKSVRAFSRKVGNSTLRFERTNDGRLREIKSRSLWDPTTATCVEGDLMGKSLAPVVGTLSDRGRWKVFHRDSVELDGPTE